MYGRAAAIAMAMLLPSAVTAQANALRPGYSMLYAPAPLHSALDEQSRPPLGAVTRTQWKRGAIIGASAGGISFGVLGYELCHDLSESSDGCAGSAIGGALIGGLVGGVVGALIGGQFRARAQ